MRQMLLLVMLGLYGIEDLRKKKITVKYLWIFAIVGVMLFLYKQDMTVVSLLCGILSGIGVIILSLITREHIGLGDGMLLIVTGIFLGGVDNFTLLCMALLYAAIFSLGIIVLGKYKKDYEIPFIPFLFFSYLTVIFKEFV